MRVSNYAYQGLPEDVDSRSFLQKIIDEVKSVFTRNRRDDPRGPPLRRARRQGEASSGGHDERHIVTYTRRRTRQRCDIDEAGPSHVQSYAVVEVPSPLQTQVDDAGPSHIRPQDDEEASTSENSIQEEETEEASHVPTPVAPAVPVQRKPKKNRVPRMLSCLR